MFKDKTSSAIVAVADLDRARAFYQDVLGLTAQADDNNVIVYRTGGTRLMVYHSDSAGTNQANAVVWDAGDDFDAIHAELKGKGVVFEEYPGMGMTIDDGVHRAGDFKAAWFKDPDGNVLHFNSM